MSDQFKLTREGEYILGSWPQFKDDFKKRRGQETMRVSETFGFVARVYEKLRSAVEYRGEHVLRRVTIERMLKRIMWLPKSDEEKAELLVKELTWSRFLLNESLTKSKLKLITEIMVKYKYLWEATSEWEEQPSDSVDWEVWLIGVASTEIEELLVPSYLRTKMAPLMFAWLKKRFEWDTETLSEKDREVQLYIAAQRALAKSDQPILRYRLILLLCPEWWQTKKDKFSELLDNLRISAPKIEVMLCYSQSNLVFRFAKKYAPVFTVLNDVLQSGNEVERIFKDPKKLYQQARQVIEGKYEKLNTKVATAIARSIIYLLVTKVIVALILELPYEYYFLEEINYIPLLINILFPPLLMLFIGVSVRAPGEENTQRIIDQLGNVIYETEEDSSPILARLTLTDRQKQLSRYFSFFYGVVFLGLVMLVGWLLITKLSFNLVSAVLFFMFLSLVLLFAYRVRWEAQELTVAKYNGGVISHMMSVLSMPFINLGAWLSAGLSQINIFMFILDVIIDAPLKAVVGGVEEWSQYLQRKEEEVVEVPE